MRHSILLTILALLLVGNLAACNRHGKKLTFKKGEVFYKPPATKAEATKLGNFLVKQKYFDDTNRKSVQLLKKGSTYQVRFVVRESILDKPAAITGFQAIGGLLSGNVFDNAPVVIHFCDKKLKTFKKLGPFTGYGDKVVQNGGEVYYLKPVTKPEAEKLAKLLQKSGYFDGNHKSMQIRRKGDVTQLRFVVTTSVENNPKMVNGFKALGKALKGELSGKGKVELHLCDTALNTLKVLHP